MWWAMVLAAAGGASEVRLAAPVLAPDTVVAGGAAAPAEPSPRARTSGRRYRLGPLRGADGPARARNPLAISAIDNERQRLVIGVRPGTGKNKLGVAYRLRLGR